VLWPPWSQGRAYWASCYIVYRPTAIRHGFAIRSCEGRYLGAISCDERVVPANVSSHLSACGGRAQGTSLSRFFGTEWASEELVRGETLYFSLKIFLKCVFLQRWSEGHQKNLIPSSVAHEYQCFFLDFYLIIHVITLEG
jgi:hypothetical protein